MMLHPTSEGWRLRGGTWRRVNCCPWSWLPRPPQISAFHLLSGPGLGPEGERPRRNSRGGNGKDAVRSTSPRRCCTSTTPSMRTVPPTPFTPSPHPCWTVSAPLPRHLSTTLTHPRRCTRACCPCKSCNRCYRRVLARCESNS